MEWSRTIAEMERYVIDEIHPKESVMWMKREPLGTGIRDIASLGLSIDVRNEAERICREICAERGSETVPCVDMHYHHLCMRCEFLAKSRTETALEQPKAAEAEANEIGT